MAKTRSAKSRAILVAFKKLLAPPLLALLIYAIVLAISFAVFKGSKMNNIVSAILVIVSAIVIIRLASGIYNFLRVLGYIEKKFSEEENKNN